MTDLAFARPDALFDLDAFEHRDLFAGAATAWDALGERLERYIEAHVEHALLGEVEEGAHVFGPVYLAEGAKIEAGAYVRGPVILGPETVVRHGAYVRGHVLAGRGAIIGHATETKMSVFMNLASAGHFAYVGDSILGHGVNLGAGTKLANFRVFPGNVKVRTPGGEKVESGLLKFGAIVGDEVQIGCNSVTAPGTIVGKFSRVYSVVSLRGTIPPHTLVGEGDDPPQRPLAPMAPMVR
ncbi:MAG: hypothetical protein KDD82_09040 [Planctomycetes bacterium]|nr:hypothetical protein [Planctomycetota bacterium]